MSIGNYATFYKRLMGIAGLGTSQLGFDICDRAVENPSIFQEGALKVIQESAKSYCDYLKACAQGYGSYRRLGGGIYTGEVSWFRPNGKGIQKWPNGDRYEGEWQAGLLRGQGIYRWSNGDHYEGGWQAGLHHGQGIYRWPNGARYEGEWQANLKHGQGIYRRPDGTCYEGGWQAGLHHGQGIYRWPNGTCYEGGWQASLRHGQGIQKWPNGTCYEGEWIRDWPAPYKNNPNLFTFNLDKDKKLIDAIPSSASTLTSKKAAIFQCTKDDNRSFQPHIENCKLLSHALAKANFESSIHYFSTLKELETQIHSLPEKIDLVWLRAHGNGKTFECAIEKGNITTLSLLSKKLSSQPTLVLESCQLGMEGMLGEEFRDRLCREGTLPTIVAQDGNATYRGFDIKKLVDEGTFEMIMADAQGKDITRILKCSE